MGRHQIIVSGPLPQQGNDETNSRGEALFYKSIFNLTSNQDIKFASFEALILKPFQTNS